MMDSFPTDVVTYRIAITPPPRPTFSTRNPISRVPFRADSNSWLGCGMRPSTAA